MALRGKLGNEIFGFSCFSGPSFLPNMLAIPRSSLLSGPEPVRLVTGGNGRWRRALLWTGSPFHFFPVLTHPFSSHWPGPGQEVGEGYVRIWDEGTCLILGWGTLVGDVGSWDTPKRAGKGMRLVCVMLSLNLPIPLPEDQQPGRLSSVKRRGSLLASSLGLQDCPSLTHALSIKQRGNVVQL